MADLSKLIQILITGKDTTGPAASSAAAGLSRMGGAIGGVLTGLGVGAVSAAAFGQAIKGAIEHASEIDKLARSLGTTTDEVQRLDYIGKILDVDINSLSTSMLRFRRGGEEASAAAARLGLSMETLRNADPTEILTQMAEALGKLDAAERTAVAWEIFGRQAGEVLAIVAEGPDKLRALTAEMDTFKMSAGDVAALDRAGDLWDAFFLRVQTGFAKMLVAAFDSDRILAEQAAALEAAMRDNFAQPDEGRRRAGYPSGLGVPTAGASLGPFPAMVPPEYLAELAATRAAADALRLIQIGNTLPKGGLKIKGPRTFSEHGYSDPWAEMASSLKPILAMVEALPAPVHETTAAMAELEYQTILAEEQANNLGAALVNSAFGFADAIGNAYAQALVYQKNFGESMKAAFKQLIAALLRDLMALIVRLAIAAALKAFISGGNPASAVAAATSTASGIIPMGSGPSSDSYGMSPVRAPRSALDGVLYPGASARRVNVTINAQTVLGGRQEAVALARMIGSAMKEAMA